MFGSLQAYLSYFYEIIVARLLNPINSHAISDFTNIGFEKKLIIAN